MERAVEARTDGAPRIRKVLVLGSDTRSFLTVIRSLGRCGVEVHTAWADPDSPALRSRYVRATHHLDRPNRDGSDWEEQLVTLLREEMFDLVIPCNDRCAIPLQENRQRWEQHPVYLLNAEAYRVSFDKALTGELVRTLGIPAPRERLVRTSHDKAIVSELDPPFVLKPVRSVSVDRLDQKNHVVHANAGDVEEKLDSLLPRTPVLVQEYFAGTGVGLEFLAHRGELLMVFQHERLHEPPSGGGSSYRRSSAVHADLRAATSKIVEALHYSGVGMVEFRYNFLTTDWIVVEINGRFWGSLPLAVAAGADFPAYLFQYLVDGRRNFRSTYRHNVVSRNWSQDLRWLFDTLRVGAFDPGRQLRLANQLFKELRYSVTLRGYSDTFVADDMGPGWVELRQVIKSAWRKLTSRARLFACRRFPVRPLHRRRMRSALLRGKSVLFVCKGNICRSPFAERYARRVFPNDFRIESCGYLPREGRSSPTRAIQAANEFQIDLDSHRSQVVTAEMVEQAGIVITFDEDNRTTLLARHPGARRKAFSLGVFASTREILIHDPYGGGTADFQAVYTQIKSALDGCAATLRGAV